MTPNTLTDAELQNLAKAKLLLEQDNFAVKIGNLFGNGVATIGTRLPEAYQRKVLEATIRSLEKLWDYSLKTMSEPSEMPTPPHKHTLYAIISGALGGVAIITLIIELPITTIIMLRAIADVARSYGENFQDIETKFACLEVFALGGQAVDPETGDTGYYAIRASLREPIEKSSKYIAEKGLAGMGSPFAAQLIAKVAAYLQPIIAVQYAVKIVPIAGATVGAAINYLFIEHFQEKAQGHFLIRQLEQKYGYQTVKAAYQDLHLNDLSSKPSDLSKLGTISSLKHKTPIAVTN